MEAGGINMKREKNALFFFIFTLLITILFSVNINAQWVPTEQLPSGGGIGGIYSLASSGANVFAGTYSNGVFLNTNNGTSWDKKSSGLPTNSIIQSLIVVGSNIFAGTHGGGVFLTTNNGSSWTEVNSDLPDTIVYSFAVSGSNIFAGTEGGIFLSTNNGSSWTEADEGIFSPTFHSSVPALAVSPNGTGGSNIFAASFVYIFLSSDNGTTWTKKSSGLPNSLIQCLIAVGSNIFAGTSSEGVYLSTDNGESWNEMNDGLTSKKIWSFAASGTNLFAGTEDGVFVTTNLGSNWEGTEYNYLSAWTLTISEMQLFSGGGLGRVYKRPLSEMITDVENLSDILPSDFYLEQNYPNPFNPTTKIKYSIPSSNHFVTLRIHDVLGREVATLVNEDKQPGFYEVEFNGSNFNSGIYFYSIEVNNNTETYKNVKKMILLK